MSTKSSGVITNVRRSFWVPKSGNPEAGSAALAIAIALLRALRDRGLLTEGEIDDLFGDAAEGLHDRDALNLLNRVRGDVERKGEE